MLPPDKLSKLPDRLVALFQELEDWVVKDISRRIKKAGNATLTAQEQASIIYSYNQNLNKKIAQTLKITDREVERLFAKAYEESRKIDEELGIPLRPKSNDEQIVQLVESIIDATRGEMTNIVRSMGFAVREKGATTFVKLDTFFTDTMDLALLKTATGVSNYNEAIRFAVKTMGNSGLRRVDYESGWSNRVDVAARRSVFGGLKLMTQEQALQNANDMGTDTFEISWHRGHRPTHDWGGRRFSLTGAHGLPRPGDIFIVGSPEDYGCLHDIYAVHPDMPRTYTDKQLKQYAKESKETKAYNFKHYTPYEAQQRQRQLETQMRATRLKGIGFRESGLEKELEIERVRYHQQRKAYKNFSDVMGLRTEYERVYYDGLGRFGGSFSKSINIITKNGTHIKELTNHAMDRMVDRKVVKPEIIDALKNPLDVGKIKIDKDTGRKSQKYIGLHATVVINPKNGHVVTLNPTGTKRLKKYLNRKEN